MKHSCSNDYAIVSALALKAHSIHSPIACTLEITYRCNLHCKMCYVNTNERIASLIGRVRTVNEWLDMARQLRDAGVLLLTITGGECLSYNNFDSLYIGLKEMGFLIVLQTNATLISDYYEVLFRKYPPFAVQVSLYGASNDTYYIVTGDNLGFDKTIRGVNTLINIGIKTSLSFTINKYNLLDLPRMTSIATAMNLNYCIGTEMVDSRYGSGFSDASVCCLDEPLEVSIQRERTTDLDVILKKADWLREKLKEFSIPKNAGRGFQKHVKVCKAVNNQCAIFWDGKMRSCITASGYYREPFLEGFECAWNNLQKAVPYIFVRGSECDECEWESECSNCLGNLEFRGAISHERSIRNCKISFLNHIYNKYGGAQQ